MNSHVKVLLKCASYALCKNLQTAVIRPNHYELVFIKLWQLFSEPINHIQRYQALQSPKYKK